MPKAYTLICVGSGGTGTYFLKEFSRYLYGHSDKKLFRAFYVIDADVVEEKNINRQAFQWEDVGRLKACVISDALYTAFDIPWTAKGFYLESMEQLEELCSNTTPIIIGAVDNHAARVVMEDFFKSRKDIYYLDSANEFTSGEVVFAAKEKGHILSPVRSHYFPEIKKGNLEKRSEMSCEALNNVAPQHIATNMLAGNILMKELTNILQETPRYGMVCFDTESYDMQFIPYEKKSRKKA